MKPRPIASAKRGHGPRPWLEKHDEDGPGRDEEDGREEAVAPLRREHDRALLHLRMQRACLGLAIARAADGMAQVGRAGRAQSLVAGAAGADRIRVMVYEAFHGNLPISFAGQGVSLLHYRTAWAFLSRPAPWLRTGQVLLAEFVWNRGFLEEERPMENRIQRTISHTLSHGGSATGPRRSVSPSGRRGSHAHGAGRQPPAPGRVPPPSLSVQMFAPRASLPPAWPDRKGACAGKNPAHPASPSYPSPPAHQPHFQCIQFQFRHRFSAAGEHIRIRLPDG